jgi:hypothetical protein
MDAFDQPFPQIAAKTGWVRLRQADVVVQMEHRRPRPVDAGGSRQDLQKLELRDLGGGDERGLAALVDGRSQQLGSPSR